MRPSTRVARPANASAEIAVVVSGLLLLAALVFLTSIET
jgi:hypothetical protein